MKMMVAVVAAACLCPSAAGAQAVRAAGMPLQDGELPPGSLTVRVVRGAFAGDVQGTTVQLDVEGHESRRAQTGATGRVEFAHLPVGARVRALAIVEGERLESETFPMPTESGVRVLLVMAGDLPAHGATGHQVAAPMPVADTPSSRAPGPSADDSQAGAAAVRATVIGLTALAFAYVGASQWRRRKRSPQSR